MLQRNGNYELGVILCAEEDAAADTSWIMGISASLVQDPSIGDDVQFGATVATIRDLDIEIISGGTFVAEPGQREEFTVYVKNNGNTIEPIDPYVTLNDKIPEGFQIQFAENTLLMLQPSQDTEIQGYLTASEDAAAGENTLLLYIERLRHFLTLHRASKTLCHSTECVIHYPAFKSQQSHARL